MLQTTLATSKFRVCVSLSFWLAILVSCSLFALVYLAPKIVRYEKLSEDYYHNQVRLVEKQNRVEHFRNITNALQNDPHFLKEMQRAELGIIEPQTESIPVAEALSLDPEQSLFHPTLKRVSPWYVRQVLPFADDSSYRNWSLISAGLLMLIGFVFLKETAEWGGKTNRKISNTLTSKLFSRYRRH